MKFNINELDVVLLNTKEEVTVLHKYDDFNFLVEDENHEIKDVELSEIIDIIFRSYLC